MMTPRTKRYMQEQRRKKVLQKRYAQLSKAMAVALGTAAAIRVLARNQPIPKYPEGTRSGVMAIVGDNGAELVRDANVLLHRTEGDSSDALRYALLNLHKEQHNS